MMTENPAARFSEVFRSDILNRRMSESEEDGMLDVEGWEEAFTTEFLERLAENGLLPDLDTSYFNKNIGNVRSILIKPLEHIRLWTGRLHITKYWFL